MNILFSKAPILYDKEITHWLKRIDLNNKVQLCKHHLLLDFPKVLFSKGRKIVHINMADQLPLAMLYKILFRVIVVYSFHGIPKPRTVKMQRKIPQIIIYAIHYFLFKRFAKYVDQFIACSKFIKKELRYLYGFDSKVIYYGINKNKFYPPKDFNEVKKKLSNKKHLILYVARFVEYKDPFTFLEALNLLKKDLDFEAILINGIGNAPLYSEILERIKEYHLEDNTKVIKGRVPQSLLKDYYQGSDVLVLPSIAEAFGTVTSEAIGCGTPVIVSNLGGPRDVVREGGLTIKMKNATDLYEKMKYILSNPEIRKKMSDKAIQRANILTWENATRQIFKIYKNL